MPTSKVLNRRTRGTEGVLDAEFDVGTQSKRLSSKLRAALPQLNRKSKARSSQSLPSIPSESA
eukprot:5260132-Amphidinium_carterae.1